MFWQTKHLSGIHYKPLKSDLFAEFLEKVNFGEEKVIRATSFVKKSIAMSFNLEKLAKLRGKRDLLKHQRWSIQKSCKFCCFGRKTCKWHPF